MIGIHIFTLQFMAETFLARMVNIAVKILPMTIVTVVKVKWCVTLSHLAASVLQDIQVWIVLKVIIVVNISQLINRSI